jgi:hypothetical protein
VTRRVVATEIFTFKAVTDRPDWARRMRSNDEIRDVESWTGRPELRVRFFLLKYVNRADALRA